MSKVKKETDNRETWFSVADGAGDLIPGAFARSEKMARQWVRFAGEKVVEIKVERAKKRKAVKRGKS